MGTLARRAAATAALVLVVVLGHGSSAGAQDIDCPGLDPGVAQGILEADPSDPNDLDRDNDGVACDNNGASSPTATATPTGDSAVPAGGVATGFGGLADADTADGSGASWPLVFGGSAAALVAAGAFLVVARRGRHGQSAGATVPITTTPGRERS